MPKPPVNSLARARAVNASPRHGKAIIEATEVICNQLQKPGLDPTRLLYRASTRDCGSCHLKPKCTPNMTFRKIPRDVHEDARDVARAWMGKPEFNKSRDERKRVEMRFAHLKTHHRFERMRLRGLSGARDEFHLAAIAPLSIRVRPSRSRSMNTAYSGFDGQHPVPFRTRSNKPAAKCSRSGYEIYVC